MQFFFVVAFKKKTTRRFALRNSYLLYLTVEKVALQKLAVENTFENTSATFFF